MGSEIPHQGGRDPQDDDEGHGILFRTKLTATVRNSKADLKM